MKKVCLVAVIAIFSITSMNAQDTRFGATAGFISATAKASIGDSSGTVSESGFYFGGFAEIGISDQFKIQPELLYVGIDGGSSIQVPVMAKYYVAEKFNLQGGLQFDFSLEDTSDDFSAFAFGLGFGAGYDITEDFLIAARYAFQLNNSYTGDADITARINYLNIGVGYRF